MKIAVTYENGQIFQHFGHTEQFLSLIHILTDALKAMGVTDVFDFNKADFSPLVDFEDVYKRQP